MNQNNMVNIKHINNLSKPVTKICNSLYENALLNVWTEMWSHESVSFIESINKMHWLGPLGLLNIQNRSAVPWMFKLHLLYTMRLSTTHWQWYLPKTFKDHNQHDNRDNNNAAVSTETCTSAGLCAKAAGWFNKIWCCILHEQGDNFYPCNVAATSASILISIPSQTHQ
jgi:hypothetical protein